MHRLARAPAVRAMGIQLLALPLMLALVYVLASFRFSILPINYFAVALIQGVLAALLTWKFGLAPWWRAIQLLFPLAVLGALALRLPSWLFLVVFLVLLGLYWSTFRTQVPYYPSNHAVWQAVLALLPPAAPDGAQPVRMIDIGSGLGGLVLHVARARPDAVCAGIELAPLPWFYSWLRSRRPGRAHGHAHPHPRFLLGDYERLDLGRYDLVFAYLSPAAMDGLWRKARAEMRPGAVLLSYEFDIPGHAPDQAIHATGGGKTLYAWYF